MVIVPRLPPRGRCYSPNPIQQEAVGMRDYGLTSNGNLMQQNVLSKSGEVRTFL